MLVKLLCDAHSLAYRETQLSGRFLLQCRCRERSRRASVGLFLFYVADREFRSYASAEEILSGLLVLEPLVKSCLYKCGFRCSVRMEDGIHLIVFLRVECKNLTLSVHYESECNRLYSSC